MFLLLFATLAWADTLMLRETEIPEELVCMAMVMYQMPCHVTQVFKGPRNIARCDLYYAGILYECNIVFNAYAPPEASILEGWQLKEVPDLMTDGNVIQIEDIGVRGSSHRYPVHVITTVRVGENK